MTLAEQLVMLALDPERGVFARGIDVGRLRRAIAAAVLFELALHGRVQGDEQGVTATTSLPDFNPQLDAAANRLIAAGGRVPLADAVDMVRRTLGNSTKRLISALVARDILHHHRQAFIFQRNPLRSMQSLREVFDALRTVTRGNAPSHTAIGLAVLADASGVLAARSTPEELSATRKRLAEIANAPHDDKLRLLFALPMALI